jgi:hypothetical protein
MTADDRGPYTLGNDGAVALVGLESPPVPPPVDVVGDSGCGSLLLASVIRESEYVRSNDCARFCNDRGLLICSLIFDSSSESDPRLSASSVFRCRVVIPVPWVCVIKGSESEIGDLRSGVKVSSNRGPFLADHMLIESPHAPLDRICMQEH